MLTVEQLQIITDRLAEQLYRDAAPGEPTIPWSQTNPGDPMRAGHENSASRAVWALAQLDLLKAP